MYYWPSQVREDKEYYAATLAFYKTGDFSFQDYQSNTPWAHGKTPPPPWFCMVLFKLWELDFANAHIWIRSSTTHIIVLHPSPFYTQKHLGASKSALITASFKVGGRCKRATYCSGSEYQLHSKTDMGICRRAQDNFSKVVLFEKGITTRAAKNPLMRQLPEISISKVLQSPGRVKCIQLSETWKMEGKMPYALSVGNSFLGCSDVRWQRIVNFMPLHINIAELDCKSDYLFNNCCATIYIQT